MTPRSSPLWGLSAVWLAAGCCGVLPSEVPLVITGTGAGKIILFVRCYQCAVTVDESKAMKSFEWAQTSSPTVSTKRVKVTRRSVHSAKATTAIPKCRPVK
ncbi:hypothetical protein C8J57DRAFT_1459768 [Mycena rebaudengoi]|nr:hypothetical protein C8J57DRAFT_1459768 [Mycena rebaudengoi]